jgi:hypothetical protein
MVKRKNLKITLGNARTAAWKFFVSSIGWFFKPVVANALIESDHDRRHYNKSYDSQYGAVSALLSGFKNSPFMKTFSTLSEANDNFIMKWYYNRLIRLPIKFGTMDFGEIVN